MDIIAGASLFAVAVLAGALNAVAGGGTFFAFPTLIFFGVPPVAANATSTVAVWPGSIASAAAYRRELAAHTEPLWPYILISIAGGAAGALILLATPSATFERLIPWLLLIATVLFAFSGPVTRGILAYSQKLVAERRWVGRAGSLLLQFGIAVYGGYFGAGIGILMLTMLALLGKTDIHQMNALKTVLGTCINGIAVIIFILGGAVFWPQAVVMLVGALIGGYYGAHYARRLPPLWIRRIVVATGSLLTLWFFAHGGE